MQITKIKAQNFMCFKNLEYNMPINGGVIGVRGINDDSSVSLSNGAGKSSLYEVIFYGLFGQTKRGLSADGVVNDKEKANCIVEVEFTHKDKTYKVIRTRADKNKGNSLQLLCEGKDITLGTIAKTQELLESILGFGANTFSKLTFFGKADLKPFTMMTDKELKEVFEEALDLGFLRDYANLIKEELKKEMLELERIKGERDMEDIKQKHIEEKIEILKNNALNIAEQLKKNDEERQAKIAEIDAEIEKLKQTRGKLKQDVIDIMLKDEQLPDFTSIDSLTNTIKQVEAKLNKLNDAKREVEAQYKAEREKLQKMLVEVGIKQSNYQSKLKEIKDEVATLQNIESLIGKSCEACAREFTKDYINQLAEHKKKSINSKMETVEKLEQEKKVAENIVEKEKSKISQSEKILEAVQSHLAHGEELLFTLRKTLSELQSLLKMKENYVKYRQNEQYGKVEEYEKQINDELSKLNDIKKKLTVLNENINKLDDDIVTLKQLERIFGGQGLRVMLLNNITPELNKIVNEYLSILDDITVEISTTKRLKSGEYRDKFEIIVNNLIGSKEIKGNSSGEQQKVNLAIALGFNKLIRSLTSASVNFIFLDEPLESLDAGSSERAIELLREFAKDISNVFIISHVADIQELADNEIVFVKRNGFTEIHV